MQSINRHTIHQNDDQNVEVCWPHTHSEHFNGLVDLRAPNRRQGEGIYCPAAFFSREDTVEIESGLENNARASFESGPLTMMEG